MLKIVVQPIAFKEEHQLRFVPVGRSISFLLVLHPFTTTLFLPPFRLSESPSIVFPRNKVIPSKLYARGNRMADNESVKPVQNRMLKICNLF